MRHPALTRVFSVVLAVLCLVMLLAGVLGAGAAFRERSSAREDRGRLLSRAEEYKAVALALENGISYEEAWAELGTRQESHEDEASEHRAELAQYTATKGGLTKGTDALDQADAAMESGWAQYYAGLEEFERKEADFMEGYEQFQQGKAQLEEGWRQYEAAAGLLAGVQAQLAGFKNLGDILDSEEENARYELSLAAFDGALAAYDGAMNLISGLVEQGSVTEEQLRQINEAVTAVLGMSPEAFRAQIQAARDDIAAGGDSGVMSEEQFAAVKELYNTNREKIQQTVVVLEAKLAEYQTQLSQTRSQLEAAQAEMDKMDSYMEQGKAGIEQGRLALEQVKAKMEQGEQALYDSRARIWYELGKLRAQEEELRREKESLEAESATLGEMKLSAEERRSLEQRETSLRLMLMERDGIAERMEAGAALSAAAADYAEALQKDDIRAFAARLAACILMILGALAGFASIPGAFEKLKGRRALIIPPALCLVCAAAAEMIFFLSDRGLSYSALGVIIFAATLLLTLAGRGKTAKKSSEIKS